jgi:hypothetical protein
MTNEGSGRIFALPNFNPEVRNSAVVLRRLEAKMPKGGATKLETLGEYAGYFVIHADRLQSQYPAVWAQAGAAITSSAKDPSSNEKAMAAWFVAFNLLSAADLLKK